MLLGSLSLVSGEARVWTSSDGRTLEGDLIRVEGEVAIVRVNGNNLRIPFEKLSAEDVVFLKEAAAKALKGTGRLFGIELKAGTTMEIDEFLEEALKEDLASKDFKPSKIVVKMSVPKEFDPAEAQKVFWMVGGTEHDADRRRGNIGTFRSGLLALEEGWIVIAADTNLGNPRSSTEKVSEVDAEFHHFLVNEISKGWPAFRSWKHACGGHSGGAQGAFFRAAQLLKAGVNVEGLFLSGCPEGALRQASQENRIRSSDWRKLKVFQSTGDQDKVAEARQVESVANELKRGGVRKLVSKTFPGNHTLSEEHFREALDWFEEEEKAAE